MVFTQTMRACPVCDATSSIPLYENRLATLSPPGLLDMSYHIAICRVCGMAYADRLPSDSAYREYYQAFSKYDVIRGRESIPAVVTASAAGTVAFLRRHIPDAQAVYDIGCSVGVLLDHCRRSGFRKTGGVDPAPQARALARELFNLDIDTGFFDEDISVAGYDVVCLSSVLEHLWSPLNSLVQLVRTMDSGSHLYIEVPAGDSFGEYVGEVFGEFSVEHINYFGRAALGQMAARVGFIEVASEYCVYPNTTTGLRGLYRLEPTLVPADIVNDPVLARSMGRYVERYGDGHMRQAAKIAQHCSGPLLLYGAGGHTARLLPLLQDQGIAIRALLDNNPNLQGKFMGGVPILRPQILDHFPRLPVVISSYHARQAIGALLHRSTENEVIDLYASGDATY